MKIKSNAVIQPYEHPDGFVIIGDALYDGNWVTLLNSPYSELEPLFNRPHHRDVFPDVVQEYIGHGKWDELIYQTWKAHQKA